MEHPHPIRALLDTNIWLYTVTHDWVFVPRTISWAGAPVTVNVASAQPRMLRNKSHGESQAIYDALEAIAEMSRAGAAILYRSDETTFEGMNLRHPTLRGTEFDVFSGVDCKFVRGPLRRDFTITSDSSREELKGEWYQFLGSIRDSRFLDLKRATSGNHTADLYHLWTAEHNELDYFITLDEKFVNAVTLPTPIQSSVIVCTPHNFLGLARAQL